MHLRQADFVDRNNFAEYLNRRGLTGEAVEVGTHRAEWAALFLSRWRGRLLTCVDPWRNPPGYEAQAVLLPGGGLDREEDYRVAWETMSHFGGQAALARAPSVSAAARFQDGTLDFVYIDGDHRREQVEADLAAWWPKVKPGGLLAGHDFLSSEPYNAYEDVQPAVLAFAGALGLDVWVVIEIAFQPWSFYLEKP